MIFCEGSFVDTYIGNEDVHIPIPLSFQAEFKPDWMPSELLAVGSLWKLSVIITCLLWHLHVSLADSLLILHGLCRFGSWPPHTGCHKIDGLHCDSAAEL